MINRYNGNGNASKDGRFVRFEDHMRLMGQHHAAYLDYLANIAVELGTGEADLTGIRLSIEELINGVLSGVDDES